LSRRVLSVEPSGDSSVWEFAVPPHLARFVAPKGSVTLDGVSLTVNEVRDRKSPEGVPLTSFTVNIIPHTAKVTNFGQLKAGNGVNLEIDMLARYVARLSEARSV
jgi:riboflavin synthase